MIMRKVVVRVNLSPLVRRLRAKGMSLRDIAKGVGCRHSGIVVMFIGCGPPTLELENALETKAFEAS